MLNYFIKGLHVLALMTLPLHGTVRATPATGVFPLFFILDQLHRNHGKHSEYDHVNHKRAEIIL